MESFGRFLRAEREARGVSIEDLAQVTKIGRQVLTDLEADHFASLPAPVFLKGFVRTIARTLALPQQETMERFEDFLATHGPDIRPPGESSGEEQGSQENGGPTPAPRESWGPMPFVLGVVGLLVAIIIAYQVGSGNESEKGAKYANQPETAAPVAQPKSAEEAVAEEAAVSEEELGDVAGDAAPPPAEETEPAAAKPAAEAARAGMRNQWIVLRARKEIWIRAAQDGEEARNFKLNPGEESRQRFAKTLEIRVGDPSRLSVLTPSGEFKTLGSASAPRTWTFPLSEEAKAELTALSEGFVEPARPQPPAPAAAQPPPAPEQPAASPEASDAEPAPEAPAEE